MDRRICEGCSRTIGNSETSHEHPASTVPIPHSICVGKALTLSSNLAAPYLLYYAVSALMLTAGCVVDSPTHLSTTYKTLASKQLPSDVWDESDRIIVLVCDTSKPVAMMIEEADFLGAAVSGGLAGLWVEDSMRAFGTAGSIFTGATVGLLLAPQKDVSSDFELAIQKALNDDDYAMHFRSQLETAIKTHSPRQTLFLTAAELERTKLDPADRLINASLFIGFTGSQPTMTAMLSWSVLADPSSLESLAESARQMERLQEEVEAGKSDKETLAQFGQAANKIMTYYAAYDRILYDSRQYSRSQWLADKAALVKLEIDTATDRLTAQLPEVLFFQTASNQEGRR